MKTVYKFSGSFCTPCKLMIPTWKAVKERLKDEIEFIEVDVESNEVLTRNKDVVSVPTFILEEDGKEVGRKVGILTKEKLEQFILRG